MLDLIGWKLGAGWQGACMWSALADCGFRPTSFAKASSCGDDRWWVIRGRSRFLPCGAHFRESLTVWRRLGAASGERLRAHEGTLALKMAVTLSSNVACTFGLLAERCLAYRIPPGIGNQGVLDIARCGPPFCGREGAVRL